MQTNLMAAEHLATNWWVVKRVANIAAGFGWVITNSPDSLIGVNLNDTSGYPVLNPSANSTVTVNLSAMTSTPNTIVGNNSGWQSSGGDWWMLAPAEVQQKYNISAGTYLVSVTANATAASGVWPTMSVYLGPAMGSATVNSTSQSVYSFTFTVPAGVGDLIINLPNAHKGTLYVDNIQITRE
jgi:hypothetical protein